MNLLNKPNYFNISLFIRRENKTFEMFQRPSGKIPQLFLGKKKKKNLHLKFDLGKFVKSIKRLEHN